MATQTIGKAWAIALLALLVGGTAERAAAAGMLTMTGTADGTLDGAPFSGQGFTVVATFSWSADLLSPSLPVASYPASLSVTIGSLTYDSAPGAAFFVVLYQPIAFGGSYGIELQTASVNNIEEAFGTETWMPVTQTFVLCDLASSSSDPPFTVPLGGTDSLVLSNFDSLGSTASIFAPEPGTLGLFGLGLAATGLLRRRRSGD
ncbi:MAG: PEP-CTERM sorting domain-containing protein [Acetobacteraceae bacterium]|jgi:hypothetical protein